MHYQKRTPKVDVEVLQAAEERFRGRRGESLKELLRQAYLFIFVPKNAKSMYQQTWVSEKQKDRGGGEVTYHR
jgi:hypothetical protein